MENNKKTVHLDMNSISEKEKRKEASILYINTISLKFYYEKAKSN